MKLSKQTHLSNFHSQETNKQKINKYNNKKQIHKKIYLYKEIGIHIHKSFSVRRIACSSSNLINKIFTK